MSGRQGSRKRVNPVVTYTWLWPGLTRAWLGEWRGFGQSAGFALLVDAMLLATVVWDEVLGSTAAWIGWSVVALAWLVGAVAGRHRLRELSQQSDDSRHLAGDAAHPQDLFPEALNEYLQGNWHVAEEKCRELIRRRRDDVEARLLLATLLRHSERPDDARQMLDEMEKFDGAAGWEMEIACERRLLDEAEIEPDEAESDETEEVEAIAAADTTGLVDRTGPVLPTRRAA